MSRGSILFMGILTDDHNALGVPQEHAECAGDNKLHETHADEGASDHPNAQGAGNEGAQKVTQHITLFGAHEVGHGPSKEQCFGNILGSTFLASARGRHLATLQQ